MADDARTVEGPRAAVPAVGVARPAHAAHLDPGLRRGDRRRHRSRLERRGRGDPHRVAAPRAPRPRPARPRPARVAAVHARDQRRSISSTSPPRRSTASGPTREANGIDARDGRHRGRHRSCSADPDRLAQVVANLVDNALKFAAHIGDGPGDSRSGSDAILVVDDDGPGIAPEDLPHVFERLYVSRHEPVRRETGSGLGLAIVHELVVAMGGTVAAEAAPTGGARMSVTASDCRLAGGSSSTSPWATRSASSTTVTRRGRLDRPGEHREGDAAPAIGRRAGEPPDRRDRRARPRAPTRRGRRRPARTRSGAARCRPASRCGRRAPGPCSTPS